MDKARLDNEIQNTIGKTPKDSSVLNEQHTVNDDAGAKQMQGVAVISENSEAKEKALASIGQMLSSNKEEQGKKMMSELPASISIRPALRKKF